ncbi:related to aldehyde dehydrogenase [Phialocephala subalpina]|uniref:aldehyde dehydrogenase (NAD(+)) n=1 Tax=Phialocephala subalpina TaxID=576137 RepID=A0A1L7XNC2_9HELO|nr:related to aldehyde dehydrogenase [Phialocephala subalpina]
MAVTEPSEFDFSVTNLPLKLFINNEYVDSQSGQFLTVHNPKDATLVSDQVPLAGPADVEAAVLAAEKALPAWKKLSNSQRRDMLLKFAALIRRDAKLLTQLNRLTHGAPWAGFGGFEIDICADTFVYNAGWIDKFHGEAVPTDEGIMQITRNEPLGVTAAIIPWNAAIIMIGEKAAPALATGNCFILKPSEKTPFAALAVGNLIKEAGFPPGVFQILSGDGSTGALLSSHMRIRKISFTGSIPTGKKVQEAAAKSNLKRVHLELGGKSPAIVFDDCDLENALTWCVNGLVGNSGQICMATTRLYVQEGIFDKFSAAYKEKLEERANTMGDPEEEGMLLGPLVDKLQFDRVTGFIERGIQEKQGTLLTGGTKQGGSVGYFVTPTVFTNVEPGAEIYTNEIFGPVSILNSFKTEEEALEKANALEYGLMAGIFTNDITRALRMASDVESGLVGINCITLKMLNTPVGGAKQSGVGRENGRAALEAFTEPKTIMINMALKS